MSGLPNGAIAVVTGAGQGIGRALALRLAAPGTRLALADVDARSLEATVRDANARGAEAAGWTLDVSSNEEVSAFAHDVRQRYARLTLLINNAGVALDGQLEELDLDEMDWLMRINFWGTVHATKALLPLLRQGPNAWIVNLSSVFGLFAPPGQSAYAASKFAVRGFTESLRNELRSTGAKVRVCTVHPGGIRTAIARNARVGRHVDRELARARAEYFDRHLAKTTPEAAAATILRGIERGRERILIGRDAGVIDLVTRLFPARAASVLALAFRPRGGV